ncbi:MAG: EamA family transporter [Candidatus Yanofskybacteria bacterium]|nr:EamA family transporter [Candidatus Yanofskybacteria bacterium]
MTGYLAILGAVSIWAVFNGLIVRGIKTSGVGVGTWTSLVGVALFFAFFLANGREFPSLSQSQIVGLVCLGVFAALNNACCYTGIKISMVNTLLFHYLAPLLIPIWALSIPAFHGDIRPIDIVALALGLCGMIWIGAPNFRGDKRWLYFASASAFFYSLEIVFSGYVSNRLQITADISALAKLSGQAMIMPIVALMLRESLRVEKKMEIPKLVLGGALLYLSFILYFSGSATVSDMHRGILGYIDRIGAIALGAYFFKEKIDRNTWVGGMLILGAGLLVMV